jgi:hypothetical protein
MREESPRAEAPAVLRASAGLQVTAQVASSAKTKQDVFMASNGLSYRGAQWTPRFYSTIGRDCKAGAAAAGNCRTISPGVWQPMIARRRRAPAAPDAGFHAVAPGQRWSPCNRRCVFVRSNSSSCLLPLASCLLPLASWVLGLGSCVLGLVVLGLGSCRLGSWVLSSCVLRRSLARVSSPGGA